MRIFQNQELLFPRKNLQNFLFPDFPNHFQYLWHFPDFPYFQFCGNLVLAKPLALIIGKACFEEDKELDSRHWLSERSYKKPEEYGPNYSKTAQSPSTPPHCVNCPVSQAGTLIILQNKCFEFPHVSLCVTASKNIRWMMDDILGNNSVTNRCFSHFVHHCDVTLSQAKDTCRLLNDIY